MKKYFTLIQLLVVITIIFLLASIIIPSLYTMKQSAYTATCISNQRQVMINVLLYASDNNWRLMPSGNNGFTNQQYAMFFNDSIYNIENNKKIISLCPADKGLLINGKQWHAENICIYRCETETKIGFLSYQTNGHLVGKNSSYSVSLKKIHNPSKTFLYCDRIF